MATRMLFRQCGLMKMEYTDMASGPTTIRARQIGDQLGPVTTIFRRERQAFDAYFQVYTVGHIDNEFGQGYTVLRHSGPWNDEQAAIRQFDAWAKKAEEAA